MASTVLTQSFSNFRVHENHLGGLIKHSLLDSTFRVSVLTSFLAMLLLLVWDPHFQNHGKVHGLKGSVTNSKM